MALKLYTYPENPRAYKSLIAARYNGVEIELVNFQFGVTNRTAEFLRLFPLGKVPALETPEGGIFESNAIARYVARLGNQSVYGSSLFETGCVDMWVDFGANELEPAVFAWLGPVLGYLEFQKKAVDKAKETLFKALKVLDGVLQSRTFLVGNRVSLADIVIFCTLMGLYQHVFDRAVRAEYPHISRWFATVLNQAEVAAVVGEFKFCEVPREAVPPQKGGAAGGDKPAKAGKAKGGADAAAAPAEGAKKGKKPAAEPAAAAAPAAPAASSPSHADEEEDDTVREEPKPKSSLDLLPKSSFNLEEWKRVYSNAKNTRADAVPWLWEKFDKEGFSFWFAHYKYNDELKVMFKTSNMIGGFHNRAEECRKYAFSSMLITGTQSAQFISGVWLLRGAGDELPDVMVRCDDCELYTWRKADLENPADKALVEDYLCWDRPIEGREVLDGKNFK